MAVGRVVCLAAAGTVEDAVVETVLVVVRSMGMAAVAAEESQPSFLRRVMVARPVAPIVAVPTGSAVPRVTVRTAPVGGLRQDLMAARSVAPLGIVVYTLAAVAAMQTLDEMLAAVAAMEAVDSCCFLPSVVSIPGSMLSTCIRYAYCTVTVRFMPG